MNPKSPRSPLHFYVLPRSVAVRIFTLLPLPSILACTQASRRIHTLITRCPEMRSHLFQEPPSGAGPVGAAAAVELHPIFSRLSFSAFHSAKAIRLAAGDGRFLVTCDVRHQFATAPALGEVVVRVVSGGEWPLDVEIAVSKKEGVTVWDVVDGVTGFFNGFSQISFGEHFGVDFCTEHEWDPRALMHNHEFLNPEQPFPTIYFPDRERSNVFIADYAFNEFASVPLVLRPLAWRRQWNVVEGVDMVEKARRAEVERAAAVAVAVAAEESSSDSSGDTEPEEEISSVGDPEDVKPDNDTENAEETKPTTGGKQEDPQPAKEPEEATMFGSLGSQSMDMDNDSEQRWEPSAKSSAEPASTGKTATHNSQEGSQVQSDTRSLSFTSEDTVPASTSGSSSLPPGTNTPPATENENENENEKEKEKEKEKDNHTCFPRPAEVLAVPAPVITITNADADADADADVNPPATAPVQDSGTMDWDDAFD